MTSRVEHFSSRWGMILAMLGMAVGTGNIWRFPRVAATNGGGSFLVAWVTFLLLWSVPLLLIEFAMGKSTRFGTIGAFTRTMGRRFAWMGAWVAWTAIAIMCYYAVVTGWTIRYTLGALLGQVGQGEPGALWTSFAWTPTVVIFQAIALLLGIFVVARGVRGIEAAAKVLIPSLFIMVVALAIRAVTLPGASAGLNFLFTPHWADLAHPRIWLEALTQNAWDTGAGWGLVLTYAIYMRRREDTALNAFMLGFGNNSVSLVAGIMVLCTVFSMMPDASQQIVGADNTGLTFIWVPQLFAIMPAGRWFMVLFFAALFFAAWTSLISMIELSVRVLQDMGVNRKLGLAVVGGLGFALGVPSALHADIFNNQDFVWGVGLMLSGLFFALAALKYGVRRFRENLINGPHSDIRIGRWWDFAVRLVVAEAITLIVWWFWQVRGDDPWSQYGIGLMSAQWVATLGLLLALNRWMARRIEVQGERAEPPAGSMPASIP